MNDIDFDRSLGFLVHDVARLMTKRFDQRAKALGLSRAQWRALAHLARSEGINQAGLAEILDVEPITLVRLIDRMEEAGWVERRPHASDRRVRLLYLTEKARAIFARMRIIGAAVRDDAMAGLADAEREQLIDLLLRVRGNLSDKRLDPALDVAPTDANHSSARASQAAEPTAGARAER